MSDVPPSLRLDGWSELACGNDGILYQDLGESYYSGTSNWVQYFPGTIAIGESWISEDTIVTATMATWSTTDQPGAISVDYVVPSFTAVTTIASTSASANGYTGLVQLNTTFTFSSSYLSNDFDFTDVGLESFSLTVIDYWLPGTGYVEEDSTETFPNYTSDPTTGIPYVSGTTTQTWTIKLINASG